MSNENDLPPANFLEHLADKEKPKMILKQYSRVICKLKDEKNFTFREIAEWLSAEGVVCDHNAVYREYTREMDFQEKMRAKLSDEDDEDWNEKGEDAHANN